MYQIIDCIYTFLLDLAPNRAPFSAKSIEKVQLQSKLGLIKQGSGLIYLVYISGSGDAIKIFRFLYKTQIFFVR